MRATLVEWKREKDDDKDNSREVEGWGLGKEGEVKGLSGDSRCRRRRRRRVNLRGNIASDRSLIKNV